MKKFILEKTVSALNLHVGINRETRELTNTCPIHFMTK